MPLHRLIRLEGLATYASQQLTPGADLAAVLLSPTLAASWEARLPQLAKLLLEQVDSSDKAPMMEWMSGQARVSEVPPRAGYYFGWRLARWLGRGNSLRDLASLPDDEVRRRMVEGLGSLARE